MGRAVPRCHQAGESSKAAPSPRATVAAEVELGVREATKIVFNFQGDYIARTFR